jgi:hypothetical protein
MPPPAPGRTCRMTTSAARVTAPPGAARRARGVRCLAARRRGTMNPHLAGNLRPLVVPPRVWLQQQRSTSAAKINLTRENLRKGTKRGLWPHASLEQVLDAPALSRTFKQSRASSR